MIRRPKSMHGPKEPKVGSLRDWAAGTLLPDFRRDIGGKIFLGGAVGILCTTMFQATQHFGLREPWMQRESLSWQWLRFGDIWTAPYLSMMVLVALAWVLSPTFAEAREFGRYFLSMSLLGWATFLVFPTGSIRPSPEGMSGAYQYLIQIDQPTNGFPCLHCGISIISGAALTRRGRAFGSVLGRGLVWSWVTLISLSTLGLRQHSDLDVIAGIILGGIVATLYVRVSAPRPHAARSNPRITPWKRVHPRISLSRNIR